MMPLPLSSWGGPLLRLALIRSHQQAWYQLGIVYRHLHRMEDAQKAMATFKSSRTKARRTRKKR